MPLGTRPKFLSVLLVLLPFLAGCCSVCCSERGEREARKFTPWMTYAEMRDFLAPLDAKDADHKNYWDRGHWLTAVEGRWTDGVPQFRLKRGEVPAGKKTAWYWWYNQSPEDFHRHLHELSDQGFTLVHQNKFVWPDGTFRYSGVWHRIE